MIALQNNHYRELLFIMIIATGVTIMMQYFDLFTEMVLYKRLLPTITHSSSSGPTHPWLLGEAQLIVFRCRYWILGKVAQFTRARNFWRPTSIFD